MGYADGYYYGQGRIICDTSTFSVGDTIRVRSMTDSSKVWNQQVATVGTALVFTVPPYDYYKICTVQDIGGVATEVGGVYKTVDYGQTLFVDLIEKKSLQGIQKILDNHDELNLLNIGDEITIKINLNGTWTDWIMQVFALNLYDTHEVILGSKHIWKNSVWYTSQDSGAYYTSYLKAIVDDFYNNMQETDKPFLKEIQKSVKIANPASTWQSITCKVWIPNAKEMLSSYSPTPPITQYQYPIFTTQAGRIRTYNDVAEKWWSCDGSPNYNARAFGMLENGSGFTDDTISVNSFGLLPCFHLTADS